MPPCTMAKMWNRLYNAMLTATHLQTNWLNAWIHGLMLWTAAVSVYILFDYWGREHSTKRSLDLFQKLQKLPFRLDNKISLYSGTGAVLGREEYFAAWWMLAFIEAELGGRSLGDYVTHTDSHWSKSVYNYTQQGEVPGKIQHHNEIGNCTH